MATLTEEPVIKRHRAGVRRARKHSLKTDMTPMVDLGFLLISFFIFTTEMNKPMVTHLNMPHDGPPIKLGNSNSLTVLLGDNHSVYYYQGDLDHALATGGIIKSNFDLKHGIGQVIREKQEYLDKAMISTEGKSGLMLLIKAMPAAEYEDVLKALDETMINQVKKYALIKPEEREMKFMDKK